MNAHRYLICLAGVIVPLLAPSPEMIVTEFEPANPLFSGWLDREQQSPVSTVFQPLPTAEAIPNVELARLSQPAGDPAVGPLDGLTIALDIGHTKKSPGAYSARGRGEFFFNQDIVEKLAPVLRRLGAKAHIINPDGAPISLMARVTKARDSKADLFVSIHHDSVNQMYKRRWVVGGKMNEYSDRFSGFSVFFSAKNPKPGLSEKLAESIGESMLQEGFKPTMHHAEKIKGENRPIIRKDIGLYEYTDLIVLKMARIPAALVECGVIVHRKEEAWLRERATQNKITNAIADGIVRYWTYYGK